MKTRLYFILFLMVMVIHDSKAQADYLPTPPSLNAQVILQNISQPVSYYTGVADIEIPIYTIQMKDISLPISLHYNTSGIKVEQEASVIGLGWNLSCGGCISRTIMGEYDMFAPYTYFNTDQCYSPYHFACNSLNDITGIYRPIEGDFTLTDYLSLSPTWTYYVNGCSFDEGFNALSKSIYQHEGGGKEFAPDVFNYSFGGYSGTFIFKRNKDIVKELEDEVKLVPVFEKNTSGIKDIAYWHAITPDGTVYVFEQAEVVEYKDYHTCNSSWYLTSIETTGGSVINFSYINGPRRYETFTRYQESGPDGVDSSEKIKHHAYDNSLYLKSITYNGGRIEFIYIEDRIDAEWLPRLSRIERYVTGVKTTIWDMEQSYFSAEHSGLELPAISRLKDLGLDDSGYNDDWNTKRLKLESVLKMTADKSDTAMYAMEYNDINLPTKLCTGIDHWGYHNGQSNGTLIHGHNADREAHDDFNQAFMLKRITYPTGGWSSFVYESNKYDTSNMEGDPQKVMYYSESEKIDLVEGYGYNNVPGDAVNSKVFTIPAYSSEPQRCFIEYEIDIHSGYFNDYFTGDMSLTLSINRRSDGVQMWAKVLGAGELPVRGEMTEDNDIFEDQTNIYLPPDEYELRITGSLRKVVENKYFACTRNASAEEFMVNNPEYNGGGLRIKEIQTFADSSSSAARRIFEYTKDGRSSGKIMSYPRYNTGFSTYSSNALRNNGHSVGYSKVVVREEDTEGNSCGYSEYEFINRPDSNYCYSWRSTLMGLEITTGESVDANPTGVMPHKHLENGQLLKESTYDASGRLIKEIENKYNIENSQWSIIWGISKEYRNITPDNTYYTMDDINTIRTEIIGEKEGLPMGYLYPAIQPTEVLLSQSVEKTYDGVQCLTDTISHTYCPEHRTLISSLEKVNHDGSRSCIKYRYPFDYEDALMESLYENNIISTPIETTWYSNDQMVYRESNSYRIFQTADIPRICSSSYVTQEDMEPIVIEEIHTRDEYGNPQWITTAGQDVVYIWGYDGQYPVCEVRNAKHDDVINASVNPTALSLSASNGSIPQLTNTSIWDGLRGLLPDAQVTTLTYIPGVGVKSIRDLRGFAKIFYYDGFDRIVKTTLQESSSSPEYIISTHMYNYAK